MLTNNTKVSNIRFDWLGLSHEGQGKMKPGMRERLRTFLLNDKLIISAFIGAAATILVYLPALNNDFVNWDDGTYIYENVHIRNLDLHFFKWAFFDFYASNWHPLTWISHAVDYALWGLNPHGHHLLSVLLHGLNTLLVVIIVMRLLESSGNSSGSLSGKKFLSENLKLAAAIITGLLFGLHPIHVESVAWVSERKDVLCAFFFLLSLLSYVRYVRVKDADASRQVFLNKYYLASLGFFLLALMSKPMAVTLPAVLLILDWYPFNRFETRKNLKTIFLEKFPYFVISLLSAIITVMAQRQAVELVETVSVSARVLVISHSLLSYLWKMLWPEGLIPFYSYPRAISVVSYEYLLSPFLVIIITAACFILAKRHKIWLATWGYFVITLLPVLGIVQVGGQMMADRYTYLPGLGPFLLLGIGVVSAYNKVMTTRQNTNAKKMIFISLSSAAVIIFSTLTIKQVHIWKNGIVLWTAVIEARSRINPQDFQDPSRIFINRAMAFHRQERFEEALKDYEKASVLSPDNGMFHASCGLVYTKLGKLREALREYNLAIHLKPDTPPDVYYNRGNVNARLGRYKDAIRDYTQAIKLSDEPRVEYYRNRGLTYERLGMLEASSRDLSQAETLRLKKEWIEFLPKFIWSNPDILME